MGVLQKINGVLQKINGVLKVTALSSALYLWIAELLRKSG